KCWTLIPTLSCSRSAATMSILRGGISNCSGAFRDSIHFRLRAPRKFISSTPVLTSHGLARASSTVLNCWREFFIRKSFQNLPAVHSSRDVRQFRMPWTCHQVIVDHADGLHQFVTNRRANEFESALY